MGMLPVPPSRNRLLSEGERKVRGFPDRAAPLGLNSMEIMYIPMLMAIMYFTNCPGSRNPAVQGLFLYQDPGLEVPQYGHLASEVLISFLQLGQRMDCL
jgi:hypothetical protein